MPHYSRLDRLKVHNKNLRKIRDAKAFKKIKDGPKEITRNCKGELLSAIWDIDARQFPIGKYASLQNLIKLRLKETDGIETPEIKSIRKKMKVYWP